MRGLSWKEEYSINHFQTDQEHKELISIANKVIAFSNNGEDANRIKHAIAALYNYTRKHFLNEEAYMERIGYKAIEHHKMCHADLVDRLNTLITQSAKMDDLVRRLKRLMVVWVLEHIINEDKKIALG